MPTISMFYGVVIQMYWDDHAPPHFHVLYAEYDATVNIVTLEVTGDLPKRAKALVLEWAEENRAALMENWTLCEQNQTPHKILPLP